MRGWVGRRVLEEARSPLLGPLMECIRSLLKEYKAELDDIFAADRQVSRAAPPHKTPLRTQARRGSLGL